MIHRFLVFHDQTVMETCGQLNVLGQEAGTIKRLSPSPSSIIVANATSNSQYGKNWGQDGTANASERGKGANSR
jgi:hypothetical protein